HTCVTCLLLMSLFFSIRTVRPRQLPSFPTRRSSDLGYLARIERGLKWPSLETLYRLAEAVGLPASSFLEDTCLITGDDVRRKACRWSTCVKLSGRYLPDNRRRRSSESGASSLGRMRGGPTAVPPEADRASARALASTLRVIRTSPAYATPRTKKTGSRRGHIALAKDIARPAPRFYRTWPQRGVPCTPCKGLVSRAFGDRADVFADPCDEGNDSP